MGRALYASKTDAATQGDHVQFVRGALMTLPGSIGTAGRRTLSSAFRASSSRSCDEASMQYSSACASE